VVVATLPTVAGFFPLWLAVSLHEGSTLLVALNSLRLLLEAPPPPPAVVAPAASASFPAPAAGEAAAPASFQGGDLVVDARGQPLAGEEDARHGASGDGLRQRPGRPSAGDSDSRSSDQHVTAAAAADKPASGAK